jgi:hypothetical protein
MIVFLCDKWDGAVCVEVMLKHFEMLGSQGIAESLAILLIPDLVWSKCYEQIALYVPCKYLQEMRLS